MQIKNVVNEVKNEYPKTNQVTKKYLSNNIPSKWLKIGLFSLGIPIIMKNSVFSVSEFENENIKIAGAYPQPTPLPEIITRICNYACSRIQILAIIAFIITGGNIIISRIKSKKQHKSQKIKKWVKVIFISSIILFVLSILIQLIINNIDFY